MVYTFSVRNFDKKNRVMGWRSTSPMEEKLKFIRAWESSVYTVSALCEAHGISRTTGSPFNVSKLK
jgi:hypothetical protein